MDGFFRGHFQRYLLVQSKYSKRRVLFRKGLTVHNECPDQPSSRLQFRAASSGRSVLSASTLPWQDRVPQTGEATMASASTGSTTLVDFYLVVGQMFLMIVPCFVHLLTLLSFH